MTELNSLPHGLFQGRSVHTFTDDLPVYVRDLTSLRLIYSRLVRKLTEDLPVHVTELTGLPHGLFQYIYWWPVCVQVRELTSLQQDVLKEVLTNTQDDVKNIVQSRESSCKWVLQTKVLILLGFWLYSINYINSITRHIQRKKKVRKFPVPSRDVTTKLSLGGNNDVITEIFLPRGSLVSDIPSGDGKLVNLFLRCTVLLHRTVYMCLCSV